MKNYNMTEIKVKNQQIKRAYSQIDSVSFLPLMMLVSLFFSSCASVRQAEQRNELRALLKQKKYEESLKTLENKDLKDDEKSRLLYYLEKGYILHSQGRYYLSTHFLEKAKELSRQLYTQSLSKKVSKMVTNDNADNYMGEQYELSLIHFYLTLNHFLLSQKGEYEAYSAKEAEPFDQSVQKSEQDKLIPAKILSNQEKSQELRKARAEILLWDSTLNASKDERRGKSVFKDDMLAKTFGAFIHEAMQTKEDDQIALQLYKDAKELLLKNYNAYQSFNAKAQDFKKDFSKFPTMELSEVLKNYVQKTPHQEDLLHFVDFKILTLTKKLRPQEFNTVVKQLAPDEMTLKEVQQHSQAKNLAKENITVVLQQGMIPEKKAEKYNFNMMGVLENIEDPATRATVAQIGLPVLANFMSQVLGLVPSGGNWNPPGALLGTVTSYASAALIGISFELPKIEAKAVKNFAVLEIYDRQKQKKIKDVPFVLLNPLADIAAEAIEEQAAWTYTRLGTRLALKHLTAILAAYTSYRVMTSESGMPPFVAKSVVTLQYLGTAKLIDASEKADVRFWSTLPQDLRMAQVALPAGDYQFKVKVLNHRPSRMFSTVNNAVNSDNKEVMKEDQVDATYDLGEMQISADDLEKKRVLNLQIL